MREWAIWMRELTCDRNIVRCLIKYDELGKEHKWHHSTMANLRLFASVTNVYFWCNVQTCNMMLNIKYIIDSARREMCDRK